MRNRVPEYFPTYDIAANPNKFEISRFRKTDQNFSEAEKKFHVFDKFDIEKKNEKIFYSRKKIDI